MEAVRDPGSELSGGGREEAGRVEMVRGGRDKERREQWQPFLISPWVQIQILQL